MRTITFCANSQSGGGGQHAAAAAHPTAAGLWQYAALAWVVYHILTMYWNQVEYAWRKYFNVSLAGSLVHRYLGLAPLAASAVILQPYFSNTRLQSVKPAALLAVLVLTGVAQALLRSRLATSRRTALAANTVLCVAEVLIAGALATAVSAPRPAPRACAAALLPPASSPWLSPAIFLIVMLGTHAAPTAVAAMGRSRPTAT